MQPVRERFSYEDQPCEGSGLRQPDMDEDGFLESVSQLCHLTSSQQVFNMNCKQLHLLPLERIAIHRMSNHNLKFISASKINTKNHFINKTEGNKGMFRNESLCLWTTDFFIVQSKEAPQYNTSSQYKI